MSPELEFDRDQIKELLEELGRRLVVRDVSGTIYVAGGAAIALEFPQRRVTREIDALFAPADTVRGEADAMAEQRGLPPNWLTDSVRAYMPPGDDTQAKTFRCQGSVSAWPRLATCWQ